LLDEKKRLFSGGKAIQSYYNNVVTQEKRNIRLLWFWCCVFVAQKQMICLPDGRRGVLWTTILYSF
jgi:hypothetical protein